MAAKTALITGAAGQDGRLLSQLLLAGGYRVVGLVKPDALAAAEAASPAVHFVAADLLDASAIRALLGTWRPDELYHLAAFHHSSQDPSVSADLASKDAMVSTNFLSTKTLAFALLEMRLPCHLVFASSSQIFSAVEHDLEISEASQRRPATFYGHAKSWSMDLLAFLRRESGLRASCAILFNHESPLRGPQFVSRKVARAAAAARFGPNSPRVELKNIGARVDWSSARDVVRALHLIATSNEPRDYVVGSGELHSVRQLLEVAFRHVGIRWESCVSFLADEDMPALIGCPKALDEALGWRRAIGFKEMIVEMVDHDLNELSTAAGIKP